MNKQDISTIMNEHEYAEIMQEAVAEICTARTSRNSWDVKRFYERYCQSEAKLIKNSTVANFATVQNESGRMVEQQINIRICEK
ncbi:MAG: hypothetical protein WCK18_19585 [Prolixibacteraceae bacterium]